MICRSLGAVAAAVLGLAMLPAPARAADEAVPPPRFAIDGDTTGKAMPQEHGTRLRLGAVVVSLEETTLAALRQRLGAGSIDADGEVLERRAWLCYTIAAPAPQRLWFIATGTEVERGLVTAIAAATLERLDPTPHCPLLPRSAQPRSPDGIWLGASQAALTARLGPPAQASADALSFHAYRVIERGQGRRPLQRTSDIIARLSRGKVDAVQITQETRERHTRCCAHPRRPRD